MTLAPDREAAIIYLLPKEGGGEARGEIRSNLFAGPFKMIKVVKVCCHELKTFRIKKKTFYKF